MGAFMTLSERAKAAVLFWKRRPLLFLASICLDVLFVVLYGFVSAPFRDKLVEHFVVISTTASSLAPTAGTQAVQTGRSIIAMLLTDPAIVPYTWNVILLLILLALAAYVSYVLVNGVLWHVVHANVGRGVGNVTAGGHRPVWHESVARFASLNIWWGLLAALAHVISLGVALRASLMHIPTDSDVLGRALEILSALVFFTIVWWSYAQSSQPSGYRGFVNGINAFFSRWRVSLPTSLVVLVPLVGVNYLVVAVAATQPTVALIIGGLLFFALLSWARALFVLSQVNHVHT